MVAKVGTVTRGIDEALAGIRKAITDDYRAATETYATTHHCSLREMRDLDRKSPAIGRAFTDIQQTVQSLTTAVAASQAAGVERQRGTAKGRDYSE